MKLSPQQPSRLSRGAQRPLRWEIHDFSSSRSILDFKSNTQPSVTTLMGAQCFTDPKSIIMAPRYHICTIFSAIPPAALVPRHLAKLVPFDEIVANPSDLKHVVKLLGCSDGLGMVILTRMHR